MKNTFSTVNSVKDTKLQEPIIADTVKGESSLLFIFSSRFFITLFLN